MHAEDVLIQKINSSIKPTETSIHQSFTDLGFTKCSKHLVWYSTFCYRCSIENTLRSNQERKNYKRLGGLR
jgi:hypothetical protein